MARNDRVQIVADAEERHRAWVRERIEREVEREYRQRLHEATLLDRLWLRLEIRREVSRRLEREAPGQSLYLR